MSGIFAEFNAIAASEERWRPLVFRLKAQGVVVDCGISDLFGMSVAIVFEIDRVQHTIYPDHNVLLVGDVEKIIELDVDDDWVHVRLKISKAPMCLDGAVPEPGPDLVQWLRQQMSSSATIEGVTDSDWTFERCIKEAASHLLVPPDQPSAQDLPSDNTQLDAAAERALPPGDAEALKLRLSAFGLLDPNAFPDLFPFLKSAAEHDDVNWDNLWEWFFTFFDQNRDVMLRRWRVHARNDVPLNEAGNKAYDIRAEISRSLSSWVRGDYHTEELVGRMRGVIGLVDELRSKINEI